MVIMLQPMESEWGDMKPWKSNMKKYFFNRWTLLVCVIAIGLFLYCQLHHIFVSQGQDNGADNGTSALVQVMKLTQRTLSNAVTAYGVLQTNPAKTVMLSAPTGGQIQQIYVTAGQAVKKDEPLLQFVPDPSSHLNYQQALSAKTLAQEELTRTERLYQSQLATHSQVDNAKKALLDANDALHAAQMSESDNENKKIVAAFDGIVTQLFANSGDRVQMGTNLLQLGNSDLVAHLGVTSEDASHIRIGTPVIIHALSNSNILINAKVIQIGHQINSQTHLIDVWALLSDVRESVLPGLPVQAYIILSSQNIWAVPQSAVLQDAAGNYIYRIQKQKAERVAITPVVTDKGWVGIQGKNLSDQDLIVTQGNYELQNGMLTRIAQP